MAPPRIISITMVKNEQDIIEPFVRHHARLVDAMVVLDNRSVDRTRRIVLECARELGNVVLTDSSEFAYNQSERMTRVLHRAQAAFFADYVLFLDTDEFVSAPDRAALLAELERIPPGGIGLMPWRTFTLKPGDARELGQRRDPPRDMRWRRSEEQPPYSKAVLRLDGRYRPDLRMEQGNHGVKSSSGKAPPAVELKGLPLLHFPVRSSTQLVAKSIVGRMAYLARDPATYPQGETYQWRDAFERWLKEPRAFEGNALCEAAMQYAQQRAATDWDRDVQAAQPPAAYERRYSNGAFADLLQLVAKSWQQSLTPPGAFRMRRPPIASGSAKAGDTAFDASWHWDNLFFDVAPFRYFAEKYRPGEVLDVGCGIGAYLWLFRRHGAAKVLGVDGIPAEATVLKPNEYAQRDLSRPLDVAGEYDLVMCTEVVEHLPPEDADRLLADLARRARRFVLFSAAAPGQPGQGHINCRPTAYWLERWAQLGWIPSLIDSMGLRCLATMAWLQHNLVLLVPGNAAAGTEAIAQLGELGARPFNWYGQPPGIRMEAFSEPLPPPPDGYAPG